MNVSHFQAKDSNDQLTAHSILGADNNLDFDSFISLEMNRLKAVLLLQRPVNEVLPTTNHLEACNGVLKHKHLRKWQQRGRQLRLE